MTQVLALFRFLIVATAILGGLHGVIVTFPLFFNEDSQGVIAFVLLSCIVAAYAYVIAAALIFWRYPNRIRPLVWAQAIQVPWISLPGLVYKFAVGLTSSAAFVFTHAASEAGDKYSAGYATHWSLGSSLELSVLRMAPLEVGVNVVPLVVLLLLRNAHRLKNQPTTAPPSSHSGPNGVTTPTQTLRQG